LELNTQNVLTGVMSALMACTGGAIMLINCANIAGLSRTELISWFFIVYFVGGSLNLALSIKYKIPFGGAHSITAVAFLSTFIAQFTWSEVAGSFMMGGIIVVVLGLTGWFNKILEFIPKVLIDAMLAGLILNYVVQIVPTLKDAPLVGGMAIFGFFIAPRISKAIPPLLGVLVFGVIGLFIGTDFPAIQPAAFSLPQWVNPQFTVNGFISIAVPMAVLILSNDIAVALAALRKNGYQPPVNKTLVMSGLGTSFVGLFGGHAVNIGGMMTALCSSEEAGPKEKRVGAAIVSGGLVALFGLFAWKVVVIIELLPVSFITLLAGFSLLAVLLGNLQSAFSNSAYRYSTLFTFVIAISNVAFLGISSPVWSLLVGVLTVKILGEGEKSGNL
jgi:benzoate membrane transport protein